MPSDLPIPGRCNAKRAKGGYCSNKPHQPLSRTNTRCKHHGGLSTGPRTAAGKAASSQNALIHGLYAGRLRAATGDDADLFDAIPSTTDLSDVIRLARLRVVRFQEAIARGELWYYTSGKGASESQSDKGFSRSYSEGAVSVEDLLERAIDLLRRLAKDQKEMNPGADVKGKLTVTVEVTAAAKAAQEEDEERVPDLQGDDSDQEDEDADPPEPDASAAPSTPPNKKLDGLE